MNSDGSHSWGERPGRDPRIRRMTLHRDHYTCQRCGYVGQRPYRDLVADAVIPDSQGGRHTLDNMQTLCIPCHKPKTAAEALAGRRTRRRPTPVHPADLLGGGPAGGAHKPPALAVPTRSPHT